MSALSIAASLAIPASIVLLGAGCASSSEDEPGVAVAAEVQDAPPASSQPTWAPDAHAVFETVTKRLPDGIAITADHWKALAEGSSSVEEPHPLLVCLHASRSSRGEYRRIAPELVKRGFDVLAVDLRFGGEGENGDRRTKQRSGTMNETWKAAREKLGREPTAVEAYADLPAIVAWARELAPSKRSRIALVGSSYSASLAMVYAAEHPKDVDAVYAFSPGEWIPGWSVAEKVKTLAVPCFVTCGSNDVDVKEMESVVRAMEHPPTVYSPKADGKNGLHGAGTLHIKSDDDRAEVWKRFDAALAWLGRDAADAKR